MADFEVKFSEINKSFKLIESGSEGDSGTGLTDAAKQAMLQIARKVAYIDEHGQTYYDDLYDALYGITAVRLNRMSLVMAAIGSTSQLIATTVPAGGTVMWASSDTSVATVDSTGLVTSIALGSCTITATAGRITATCAVSVVEATLVSINAVYTQSGTVYDTADLNDLKTDLVVTASWSSGTTSEVASSDYALSGTLTAGTSTVTVTYGECTDTFTVNVTAAPTLTSISAVYTQSGTVYDTDTLDSLKPDLVVTAHYSDQTTETVTTYTLSGTLTEGTSTVTVAFGGQTTTFSVTVTELVIVIPNGSFTFGDGSSVTVHNNHVQIFLKTHVHASSTGSRFVNLSSLNSNTSSIFTNDNANNQSTEYLSAEVGDVVTVGIKNATADNTTWSIAGSNPPFNVAFNLKKKDSTSSALSRAVTVYPADNPKYDIVRNDEVIDTVSSAYTASCLFCYISYTFPAETTIDFDVVVSKE